MVRTLYLRLNGSKWLLKYSSTCVKRLSTISLDTKLCKEIVRGSTLDSLVRGWKNSFWQYLQYKTTVTDDLCAWSGHLMIKQPRNQLTTAGHLISKPRSAASMTPAWHYYSTGVIVDEAEWMNSFFRVLTQVKRQLGIDCGQKGSQYISYCRWLAASTSRGGNRYPTSLCFFLRGKSCEWIRSGYLSVWVPWFSRPAAHRQTHP